MLLLRWAFDCTNWEPTSEVVHIYFILGPAGDCLLMRFVSPLPPSLLQEWEFCLGCVGLAEAARIRRFRFRKDAKLAMAGRLLLLQAAARLLRLPSPQLARFERSPRGRPVLVWIHFGRLSPLGWLLIDSGLWQVNPVPEGLSCATLDLNISHHGSWVVLAAEGDAEVGVDVVAYEHHQDHSGFLASFETQVRFQIIEGLGFEYGLTPPLCPLEAVAR